MIINVKSCLSSVNVPVGAMWVERGDRAWRQPNTGGFTVETHQRPLPIQKDKVISSRLKF